MKSTCISWPAHEPLILIRTSQMQICEGDHCTAALLSFFEHCHNSKLDHQKQAEHMNRVANQHGEEGTQDTSLLQWHTEEEFEAGLLHLYGRKKIRQGIQFLIKRGFVTLHENPNARYHFDKTHYFLFHPEKVSSQLIDFSDEAKMPDREGQNAATSGKKASSCGKKASSITEISSEITSRDEEGEHAPAPAPVERMPVERMPVDTRDLERFEARFSPPPHYRCPTDFVPDPAIRPWAQEHFPAVHYDDALEAMRDFEFQRPRSDWNAALKTWIRREAKEFAGRPTRASPRAGASYVEAQHAREEQAMQEFLGRNDGTPTGRNRLRDGDEEIIDGVEYRVDE